MTVSVQVQAITEPPHHWQPTILPDTPRPIRGHVIQHHLFLLANERRVFEFRKGCLAAKDWSDSLFNQLFFLFTKYVHLLSTLLVFSICFWVWLVFPMFVSLVT